MKNRFTAIFLLAAMMLGLCGCGSVFDREYVLVEDYEPTVPQESDVGDKVTVKTLNALRQAIMRWVNEGETEGHIVFDSDYSGNPAEDLAIACWQVRTQNAICAYCVENISYELNRIVTNEEASVRISYTEMAGSVDDIIRLTFSSTVEDIILDAISSGKRKLAVYIVNGTYTAEGMENLVTEIYREHPICTPKEPRTSVNVYSGTGLQRLYEMYFNYSMDEEEFALRKQELEDMDVFADTETEDLNNGERALQACLMLAENCAVSDDPQNNSAYSALIGREASSEGFALAYVELCHELGLNCETVYGQKDWESFCWNMVEIDGSFYHVDIIDCIQNGVWHGFLKSDRQMWGNYRWDTASYASCDGALSYAAIAGINEMSEAEAAELPEEENEENADDPVEEPSETEDSHASAEQK